jgi:hypothetical protein
MPNSPPPPPSLRAAMASTRRQLTWCRYPMQEFTLRLRPRTPPPSFRPPPLGLSLRCCVAARLPVNGSDAGGVGFAAGRRICHTGLDRPTGTPPPARPGLAAHRRGGSGPGTASPRELLREHGALLALRGGGLGFDGPPPAERLREYGQMLMLSSEPPPPPLLPACAAGFLRFSFSFSFSSAGFLEKMSVHRFDPPAAGGCREAMAALGDTAGAAMAAGRRDASPRSGLGSGSVAGDTWLLRVPECEAALGGRTGSGRRKPPAKSSSAQDGEAVGLASSGQNWNSAAEEALLLLAPATSIALAGNEVSAAPVSVLLPACLREKKGGRRRRRDDGRWRARPCTRPGKLKSWAHGRWAPRTPFHFCHHTKY